MSEAAENLDWLLTRFVDQVPSIRQAVVVSSDGLPLAASQDVESETADRLAAVSSGLIGLAYGSAGRFGAGSVTNILIEMQRGWMFVTGISDGSLMCVVTTSDVDVGMIAYNMAVFAKQAGDVLTPAVRHELQSRIMAAHD